MVIALAARSAREVDVRLVMPVGASSARELIGRTAGIEAPATIANLGAGYDCLGLAVELPLRVTVEATPPGSDASTIDLTVEGDSIGELPSDRSNRFVVALEAGLTELGFDRLDAVGWRIRMSNPIPLERGLGSSAAATVAGIVAAYALADRAARPGHRAAARDEHRGPPGQRRARPARRADREHRARRPRRGGPARSAARASLVVAWIPERKLPTSEMRRVLPDSVPRADAIANLARVAVGVAGLASGRKDVLRLLTDDRLHEPYRAEVYPELPRLVAAAREAGALGACLAGAGLHGCRLRRRL